MRATRRSSATVSPNDIAIFHCIYFYYEESREPRTPESESEPPLTACLLPGRRGRLIIYPPPFVCLYVFFLKKKGPSFILEFIGVIESILQTLSRREAPKARSYIFGSAVRSSAGRHQMLSQPIQEKTTEPTKKNESFRYPMYQVVIK